MQREKNFKGILLKLERLKQNKMQKEVCYGICVVSYLSKIERGYVDADEDLLQKLFERLDIKYCIDEGIMSKCSKMIERYYYELEYDLPRTIYDNLLKYEKYLKYSAIALDFYIVQANESNSEVLAILDECTECMTDNQLARYYMISRNEDKKDRLEKLQKAYRLNNNSYMLNKIMWVYFELGEYTKVNNLADKCVQLALEEGNTKSIADCYLCQGTTYACLNIDDMMKVYYERCINILQNTGWKDECSDIYYNIGAVYLSLKKYDSAMEYLNKCSNNEFLINHKKALVKIRSGHIDEAQEYIKNMNYLCGEDSIEKLMYKELLMECEEGFLNDSNYIKLLEELIDLLKQKMHFGYIYFYKDVLKESYCRQRKYRKALEIEEEFSSKYKNLIF